MPADRELPFRLPVFRLPVFRLPVVLRLLVVFRLPALFFLPPEVFFLPPAVFFRPPDDFVVPCEARRLLTVAAAICFARFVLRPAFSSDSLMCSYWRAFFAPFTPRGGMLVSSSRLPTIEPASRPPSEARCVLVRVPRGVRSLC